VIFFPQNKNPLTITNEGVIKIWRRPTLPLLQYHWRWQV